MLDKPPHIRNNNIADPKTQYPWDEWAVQDAYRPADPDLVERMVALSPRANVAMTAAIGEWVVWRFEGLSQKTEPLHFLEAAWASIVHTAYARYAEFDNDKWRGVIHGPQLITMYILLDLIWGIGDNSIWPGKNAAWMSKLACLVLPDPKPFIAWRDECIERLEQYYPKAKEDEDDIFEDNVSYGAWVPRELFDLTRPFDPTMTRPYLEQFLRTIDYNTNPFLNEPSEMLEFEDYEDTPYQLPDDDPI